MKVCVWGFSLNKQVPKSVPITPIKWCSHQHLWVPGPQEPAGLSERIWLWGTLTQPVIHEAATHMRSLYSVRIISEKIWRNSFPVFITDYVLYSVDSTFKLLQQYFIYHKFDFHTAAYTNMYSINTLFFVPNWTLSGGLLIFSHDYSILTNKKHNFLFICKCLHIKFRVKSHFAPSWFQ